MSTHEPTDPRLGKPLKVEGQSVDTELTPQEVIALDDTHERALQQLSQLRTHLEAQRQHLETTGGTIRKLFERVRGLWSKQEQSATAVVRLGIEMDHLEDKVRHASPRQIERHLGKKLAQLQQQIEQIQLVSVEVDRFTEKAVVVEDEDTFPIEAAGGMKNWSDTLADEQGKLGKYGQDCVRSNPETGTITVADGMSSGVDSFEIARRATRRAQEILDDIPLELCATEQEVKFFVQGHLGGILNEINALPSETFGGTTLLVTRYLEKFDAIVMIDIGDCEACAVADSDVLPIKSVPETMKTPPHISKVGGDGLTVPEFIGVDVSTIVKIVSLREFRQAHPNESIQILLTTDGLKNNSGKTLEQQALKIVEKGTTAVVAEVGTSKDDMTILKLTIPPLEAVKAKEVAA